MSITKVPTELIDPGKNAEPGDTLKVGDQKKIESQPDETLGQSVTVTSGEFDSSSGTLLIRLTNNEVITIEGLPTEQTIGKGPEGKRGKPGNTGDPGTRGRDGKNGEKGCAGNKGDRGMRGSTGVTGSTGSTGHTGAIGHTGPTGSTGPRGLAGQEPVYVAGSDGSYEYTVQHGRIMEWGTYKGKSVAQAVEIIFPLAFSRECTAVTITITKGYTFQAQNYELTWDNESLKLEVPINTPVPLADEWEFTWTAYGD